jgi:predicted  nucleic acid-binding Zn-ribbon protein
LPSITAEEVVNLFEADVRARKRLAELLVSEPDVRLAIINAVLRDVATKDDIEALKNATKSDVEALRREVESLRRDVFAQVSELRERVSKLEGAFTQLVDRMGDLDKRMDYVAKVSWTLTISVLAALVAHLILALLRAP